MDLDTCVLAVLEGGRSVYRRVSWEEYGDSEKEKWLSLSPQEVLLFALFLAQKGCRMSALLDALDRGGIWRSEILKYGRLHSKL